MVPTTPWTDEAVPAIGPICAIARVLMFDEVKAKQAIASPWKTMKTVRLSAPAVRDPGVDRGDDGERQHAAMPDAP